VPSPHLVATDAAIATDMIERFAGKEGPNRDALTAKHPVGRLGKYATTTIQGQISGLSGAVAKLAIQRHTLESKIKVLRIDKLSFRVRQILPRPPTRADRSAIADTSAAPPTPTAHRESA
jgi:hypothetical protein